MAQHSVKDEVTLIVRAPRILIYGAKNNAADAVLVFTELCREKLLGCAVTSTAGNVPFLFDCPVRAIDDYDAVPNKADTVVIVAMMQHFYSEIETMLTARGYRDFFYYGDENEFMRELHEQVLREKGITGNWHEYKNQIVRRMLKDELWTRRKRHERVV